MGDRRYILGLGCPRSGTTALAGLLDAQAGVAISHEDNPVMPWEAQSGDVERAVEWMERGGHFLGAARRPVTGDVSVSWLPALAACRDYFGDALTVVALCRDKEDWMDSVIENIGDPVLHDRTTFADQFPTYDLGLRDAWSRYYDTYYANVPEECIYDMMCLGDREGQDALLEATKMDADTRIYTV